MRTHLFDGDTNGLSKPIYCALSKRREQPATLGSTSPDTPYRSDWNTQYLLSYTCETTSCVGQQSSASACCTSVCSCTLCSSCTAVFLWSRIIKLCTCVYCCLLLYCVVSPCIVPPLASLPPRVFVWMSQQPLPPSFPCSPNATVRTPHPLDSQTWDTPSSQARKPITSRAYRMQMALSVGSRTWLTVTFSELWFKNTDTVRTCLFICPSLLPTWLQIKMRFHKLHENTLVITAWCVEFTSFTSYSSDMTSETSLGQQHC